MITSLLFTGCAFIIVTSSSQSSSSYGSVSSAYTGTWHSRCDLVLNRNLPLDQVHVTDEALDRFALAPWNPHLVEDLDKVCAHLQKNRFLTLGQIRYHLGRPGRVDALAPLVEKLSKLF